MKRVLLIGGTDSSGGAGLTRDASVAHEHGCLAKPVVTCVTAQTNAAVRMIHEVPASVIVAQIDAAFADTPLDTVKIGMVGTRIVAKAIGDTLKSRNVPIVLDPVLTSTSGSKLSDEGSLESLIAIATLMTPNLEEASRLCDRPVAHCDAELSLQAKLLRGQGANAVLLKGGHGRGDTCCDHLFDNAGHQLFCLPRLMSQRRGTGCSLATALACELAFGQRLRSACDRAKKYVHDWIADQ